jgi:2'-5' RNA ligase
MSNKVRKLDTMVAIYPSVAFHEAVAPYAHPDMLKSGLHVTLLYLGETSPDRDMDMRLALEKAVKGFQPLTMYNNGPGCFINAQDQGFVRKLTMNAIGLDILRYKVVNELWKSGFMGPQNHGFSAHMTLEYHKDFNLPPKWEECGIGPYPTFEVNEIFLVRSNNVIATIPLTRTNAAKGYPS